MLIIDEIVEAPVSEAMDEGIKDILWDLHRESDEPLYIGVTSNLENRAERHGKNGWSQMTLVYRAFNSEIAELLERDMIDYARRCDIHVENIGDGGEGIVYETEYLVYILSR